MDKDSLQAQTKQFFPVLITLVGLVLTSTVFFHFVEGWSWLNSYYFTIVTVATVGYGDFTPKTDLGKIGATIVIIVGIGLFSAFVSMLLKRQAIKRLEKKVRRAEEKLL